MGSDLPPGAIDAAGRRIAAALLAHRHEASLHLLNSISDWPRWRADIAADATGHRCGSFDLLQPLMVFVDYLGLHFSTADAVWKRLYVGEKLRLLHEPGLTIEQLQCRREQMASDDQRGLLGVFRRKLRPDDFARLQAELAQITHLLATQPIAWIRALLIGDFLQLDVLALLSAQLLEANVALLPTCLANADRAKLHLALRQLAHERFDFVFYTPMSDLDCPPEARLHAWTNALSTGKSAYATADTAARQAMATVELLGELWECPIVVNDAAGVARHDDRPAQWLAGKLGQRVRRQFCQRVNRRLAECLRLKHNVRIFDEHALLTKADAWSLGRVLHLPGRKHPIVLGHHVADGYAQLIIDRLASAPASPEQLIGTEDRTIGAGQAIDPVLAAPLR